jgi:hypothetical protein
MMSGDVVGIDPGAHGAIAVRESGRLLIAPCVNSWSTVERRSSCERR